MPTITDLNEARRQKALRRLYRFDGQVMTLGEFIASKKITHATAHTRTHENHRRELEYKELAKPITEYTLWYKNGERELGIDVPKLVYDFIIQQSKGELTNE